MSGSQIFTNKLTKLLDVESTESVDSVSDQFEQLRTSLFSQNGSANTVFNELDYSLLIVVCVKTVFGQMLYNFSHQSHFAAKNELFFITVTFAYQLHKF